MSYEVHLDVFEGPFQLLLALIGDKRVDVCDVPIAQLTNDYLASLQTMAELDLDVTTEFLVVAATLLQLKARALIPSSTDDDDPTFADDLERDLLISRLLEVRTFQAAGEHVRTLIAEGDKRWSSTPASNDEGLRQLPVLADIQAATLARILVEMIQDANTTVDLSLLFDDEVSTQQAAAELTERLAGGTITFRSIISGRSLAWAVAFFLAMLEMGARGEVALGQSERLGDIEIVPITVG